jgi:hypothetical protein
MNDLAPRKLTAKENAAVERLRRALENMPSTLSVFAEGASICVYDCNFLQLPNQGEREDQKHIVAHITPSCPYDAGGW